MTKRKIFYLILAVGLLIILATVFFILEAPIKLFSPNTAQLSPPTPPPSSGPSSGTPQAEVGPPKGIYLLLRPGQSAELINNILSQPFVDGAVVGGAWNELEPSEGQYNWAPLDTYIDMVKAKGKKFSLVLFPGRYTPDWVYAEGVKKWNWVDHKGQNVTYPNPTDPKFYEFWKDFVRAAGNRYDKDSSLFLVKICGGTGALCGLRFYELPPDWDANAVVNYWKPLVDTYVQAFPSMNFDFEIHTTIGQGTNLSEQMMSYNFSKYGSKIGLFQDFLSSTAPTGNLFDFIKNWGPKSSKTWCGFQQNHAQGTASALDQSYSRGFNDLGCLYYEIYQTDLKDPSLASVNQKWHDLIWGE